MTIAAATHIGAVRLRVSDVEALTTFYERAIGLRTLARENGLTKLGAHEDAPLVELVAAPGAPARPPVSTGLFHMAILVPERADLARALVRLSAAGWRLTGASDHLVSEALYLNDAEGNGIEIYRDRPREEWRRDPSGELAMATLPLDLEAVLRELGPGAPENPGPMPAGTRMGHVHLQVSDLGAGRALLRGAARARRDGALLSRCPVRRRGRISPPHRPQHVAERRRAGAPRGGPGTRSLRARAAGRERARPPGAARSRRAPKPLELEDGVLASDPSGNRVLLRA